MLFIQIFILNLSS